MSDVVVTPPDQTVWWDDDEATALVLDILRLGAGDVDAARIRSLSPVAGEHINNRMDRTGVPPTPVPARWIQGHAYTIVALYRQKDSPPSDPDISLGLGYVPADPLAEVWPLFFADRQRWGVG